MEIFRWFVPFADKPFLPVSDLKLAVVRVGVFALCVHCVSVCPPLTSSDANFSCLPGRRFCDLCERADRGIAEKLVDRRWGDCDGSEVHVEMRFRKVVAKFVIELKIELSGMSLSGREILKLQENGRIEVFKVNKNRS